MRANEPLLLGYATASIGYRVLLTLGIALLVTRALRPLGLEFLANGLLVFLAIGLIAGPLTQAVRFAGRPGALRDLSLARVFVTVVIGGVLAAVLCWAPVPHRVLAPFHVTPRDSQRLYVQVGGTLAEVLIRPGEAVSAGQPIARLTNPEVDREVVRLEGELERLEVRLQNLRERQLGDPQAADALPAADAAIANLRELLRRRRQDQARLLLVADRDGVVMPPPAVSANASDSDELAVWSGLPTDPWNLGCRLGVGTLYCVVGRGEAMDALLLIDENDIDFVRRGQRVDLLANSARTQSLSGSVAGVAKVNAEQAPLDVSHKTGGDLSTLADEFGNERPLRVVYEARVPLEGSGRRLLPRLRGRASIHVDSEPLGPRLLRLLRQTFIAP